MRRRKAKARMLNNGESLVQTLMEKGAKGIKGQRGYLEMTDYTAKENFVAIPVEIIGLEMRGCAPQFFVKPIDGCGEIALDSPCQFIPEDGLVDAIAKHARELRYETADALLGSYNRTITRRRSDFVEYVKTYVPEGFHNTELLEEMQAQEVTLDKPSSFQQFKLDALTAVARKLAFPDLADQQ